MAADAEYGPHLQALFTPLMTGVGPVEAGVTLGAELARLKAARRCPISSSRSARPAAARWSRPKSTRPSRSPIATWTPRRWASRRARRRSSTCRRPCRCRSRIPGIKEATLSTGGAIISGAAYDAIAADMVDMETFACLRACQLFGVPLIGLRGISDGAADLQPCRRLDRISACHRREARRRGRPLETAIDDGAIASDALACIALRQLNLTLSC